MNKWVFSAFLVLLFETSFVYGSATPFFFPHPAAPELELPKDLAMDMDLQQILLGGLQSQVVGRSTYVTRRVRPKPRRSRPFSSRYEVEQKRRNNERSRALEQEINGGMPLQAFYHEVMEPSPLTDITVEYLGRDRVEAVSARYLNRGVIQRADQDANRRILSELGIRFTPIREVTFADVRHLHQDLAVRGRNEETRINEPIEAFEATHRITWRQWLALSPPPSGVMVPLDLDLPIVEGSPEDYDAWAILYRQATGEEYQVEIEGNDEENKGERRREVRRLEMLDLPSHPEREYLGRGRVRNDDGSTGALTSTTYFFDDDDDPQHSELNAKGVVHRDDEKGELGQQSDGLYTCGNAWDCTRTTTLQTFTPAEIKTQLEGLDEKQAQKRMEELSSYRVILGGGAYRDAGSCAFAFWGGQRQDDRNDYLGFRLVRRFKR